MLRAVVAALAAGLVPAGRRRLGPSSLPSGYKIARRRIYTVEAEAGARSAPFTCTQWRSETHLCRRLQYRSPAARPRQTRRPPSAATAQSPCSPRVPPA